MSQLGLTNNIVTATGILGCAWWAGMGQSLSIFSVAAALETSAEPIHALKLWQGLFNRGHSIGPKTSGIVFLSLAYSAYDRYRHDLAWKPFIVAGALCLAIVPYTFAIMGPTNERLMAGAQGLVALGWSETRELLMRWQTLNFVRSFLPIAGAAVGLWYAAFP